MKRGRRIAAVWVAAVGFGAVVMGAALGQVPPGPAVVATIRVGSGPAGVAVDPATNTVLVANSENYGDDSLAVVDGARRLVVDRIPDVASDVNADAVVFDPATGRFFVSAKGAGEIVAVDPRSRAIVASVPNPAGASGFLGGMAPHPGTGMLYAVDWSGTVYGFDSGSLALKATIPLPPAAREGLINAHPVEDRLYVSYGGGLVVIGARSQQIETRVPVPVSSALAIDPQRARLYGADANSTLYIINAATYQVVSTIQVGRGGGAGGRGLAFSPGTGRVYIANPEDGTVSVVDGGSGALVATVTVGKRPNRIAVNPSTNRVYVTNRDDGTLTVIEDR